MERPIKGVSITQFCDTRTSSRNATRGWHYSSPFVRPSSTPIRRESSTATSNPRTFSSRCNDGEPMVKVIDFGVAKATNQEFTDKTLFTAFGQMVGTPAVHESRAGGDECY